MRDTTQPGKILPSGRLAVLLSLSLTTMIGCQANQPNTKAVPAELREGMWQGELEQLMRSRGVVLIGTRNLGAGAGGQARDYRFGDKVLRVSLYYPILRHNEEWRPERYVSNWKFIDLEAEKRQEKLAEKEWEKVDMATKLQLMEDAARVTTARMRKLFPDWPNARERPTTQSATQPESRPSSGGV